MHSKEGREQLKYLISCALPPHITMYGASGGKTYTFKGSMGLAPDWLDKGLTPSEERWVSACMLARTNAFGKHVKISMRADRPSPKFLRADKQEQKEFPLFEGGYFGNLFLENPVAYVCLGNGIIKQPRDPILDVRVCALPLDEKISGHTVTACGFIVTGQCSDTASRKLGSETYPETIYVYLKPGLGSMKGKK